jgi:hypothetical protein
MGFKIEQDASQAPNGAITTDRRLFIAEDQKTLVEEGDVRARTQLAAPGHLIAAKDVERLGLALEAGRVIQPSKQETPAEESKQREPAEDKQRAPGENKAGKAK